MNNKKRGLNCHTFVGGPEKTLKCRCTKTAHAYSAETALQFFALLFEISQVSNESEKQNASFLLKCLVGDNISNNLQK